MTLITSLVSWIEHEIGLDLFEVELDSALNLEPGDLD